MVCHIWKENDKLYIVPSWEDIVSRIKSWSSSMIFNSEFRNLDEKKYSYRFPSAVIPFDSIIYYIGEGQVTHGVSVSGGGGGGVSVGGAVAGAVLAGPVGAVIGGRKKVTGPQVHSVTHDDRTSYILYKDENGDVKNIHLTSPSSYEVLKNVIPDKDYNYIMLEQADDQKDSEEDILEKLTKLAQLRDQDIVSEEEFSIKKQELLSRL